MWNGWTAYLLHLRQNILVRGQLSIQTEELLLFLRKFLHGVRKHNDS